MNIEKIAETMSKLANAHYSCGECTVNDSDKKYSELLTIADTAEFDLLAMIEPLLIDSKRYQLLREADIDAIKKGGVFVGITPENLVINGIDLDAEIDKRLLSENVSEVIA